MRASTILGVLLVSTFVYGGTLNGKLHKREINRCYQTNEEYTNCGSACPNTCDTILQTSPTVFCPALCVPGCFCKQGYVRNRWGNCIPQENCPCHGQDEEFSCGSTCQVTCANNQKCPILSNKCVHACRCRDGFVRDKSNVCIPVLKCSDSN